MISLIAAIGKDRVLGFRGRIPWNLPADLRRFRDITRGHAVIMGRKTFESIGKPLPDRTNIIVTTDVHYHRDGCRVAHSISEALTGLGNEEEAFVIGGGEIYRLALPYADRLYISHVDAAPTGDVFFPEIDMARWKVYSSENFPADQKNEYGHTFVIYERIAKDNSTVGEHSGSA